MTLSSLEIKIQLATATIFHYSMKLQDAYFSKASLFFLWWGILQFKKAFGETAQRRNWLFIMQAY